MFGLIEYFIDFVIVCFVYFIYMVVRLSRPLHVFDSLIDSLLFKYNFYL
jgi:hypothetical protein